nr:MAG TPA: hypothetical protein [Caudoviricetes sp.]DAM95499.1 MAG TPA: hypothetical protein [Caudoviricetes sp.]
MSHLCLIDERNYSSVESLRRHDRFLEAVASLVHQ